MTDEWHHATAVLRGVQALAAERRPDDAILPPFLRSYYGELPEFDADDRLSEDLYAAAQTHLNLGRTREPGETHVAVVSPDRDRDGWHSDRSIVLIVTDDVPFLVDTVRIALDRRRISTHLLVHPMLRVTRDAAHDLDAIVEGDARAGERVEAWTQVEIDRLDAGRAEELRTELCALIADVHRVVADFEAMRARMDALATADPLLEWLSAAHYVFLGSATFDLGVEGATLRPGSELGQVGAVDVADPPIEPGGPTVSIARSRRMSPIHRNSRYTAVTVLGEDDDGRPVAQRFVGLLASTAYRVSVLGIPTIGDRARAILGLARDGAETHTGRSMRNVLETLPRDLVFELDADRLAELVIDVVGLQERQIVRVFDVPEPVGDSATVLVFLPRRRFNAQLPERVAELIGEAYGSAATDVSSFLETSNLARIALTIAHDGAAAPDLDELSERVDELTTAWIDRVHDAANRRLGESRAARMLGRVAEVAPESYRTGVDPLTAVGDLERLLVLIDSGEETRTALVRDVDAEPDVWRMRLYRQGEKIALSTLMPMFGHLGITALDEHPYQFEIEGHECFLYDIGIRMPSGVVIDDGRHHEIRATFEGLLRGEVERDGFNRLVVLAGLTAAQVNILRCYAKYAHQIGFTFSQGYIEDTFARLPQLAGLLVELFEARFDPDVDDGDRIAAVAMAGNEVLTALDAVPSLDEDRIGRLFLSLINATVRTTAYRDRATTAFKFDPSKVPDLPQPRPMHEIFVCSARVEGVHLRGGAIARGGLRWSDRREDYRTEVLGLVKAQMVKNAVIVPVGAKGGFVVKQPKDQPAEQRDEVVECYRMFVRGLLDLTDNVVAGETVPPERVVCYDDPDPYLVVAADKGTATFSDTANEIAAEYDFWLGDAFASGGSAGYDHKAMGITARGAWESVVRHASVLGKNADTDELTAVGIGDMSGDVFGNGMLCSPHLRLVAAFDHRHVFVDPNPDPATSFAERQRLFDTPRSSWAEYDTTLISEGGGVFARTLKSIELTPQMREALGTNETRLTPNQLISTVLRAPVDLLWNGGVGTYVKSSGETHAEVGDRSNDGVRVDASELRCKILSEGGNLGVTQLGRVEFALNGGLIHTDAIDNSAGVDCSDHEVNIKVLLGSVVADGELTVKQRNQLLEEMTDEVAELVLANNRAQTLALLIARRQGLPMVNVHARYLDHLEAEGWLDRQLEDLPTDKQIAERQSAGSGLRTPEFAVLIATTKNAAIAEIMPTDLPDAAPLEEDLINYFPKPLRERYHGEILGHRLRREIATTQLVNHMVNLSGISYGHRMTEDTGASITDVARAWLVAREILDFPAWWDEINELPGLALEDHLELFLECRRTAERCSLWFLRHRRPPVDIDAEIKRFRDPVLALVGELRGTLCGPMAAAADELAAAREEAGAPADLAQRSAVWRLVHTAFDVVELAERAEVPPVEVASAYWSVFDRLELLWLWDGIGTLPRGDRWQTQARGALRDDLLTVLAELAGSVIEHDGVDAWLEANPRSVERAVGQLTLIRRTDSFDISNLSVAIRQLRNLAITSI